MVATAPESGGILGKPLGLACAHTSTLVGIEPRPILVEVCCTRGPSFFQMVGLAEASVKEARVRVAAALAGLGVLLDEYAITLNLAPADLRKSGAALDVAIAVGILAAVGELEVSSLENTLFTGELALDGAMRPVRGVLPLLHGARERQLTRAIVPARNGAEAGLVDGIEVRLADDLAGVVAHLMGDRTLPAAHTTPFRPAADCSFRGDLSDVRGQPAARRALELAAAGGHNLLMMGPPGGGKTMLARLLPTILPPLSFDEAIETTAVHSVAGLIDSCKGVVDTRPFRAPHHSVSEAGLVGGGDTPRPGEISLAHNGVLFLDELAEFRRNTLEALRQPLEDGRVCIARARATAWFPARPTVVAAVNPCPCGYFGHPTRPCRCSEVQRLRYQARISGPVLDRLDVHVTLPPVELAALTRRDPAESSLAVRERVTAARARQLTRRDRGLTRAMTNASLSQREVLALAEPNDEARHLLSRAVRQLGLSARAFGKVLRVARTIADLEGSDTVHTEHFAEAIQGRLLDKRAAA